MSKWSNFPDNKPKYNEPVLCLLNNGQQIVLALDEMSQEWFTYDEEKLLDAHVIGWKELESRSEIEKQLYR